MNGTYDDASPDCPDAADETAVYACCFGLSPGENVLFEEGVEGLHPDFVAYRVSSEGSQVWRWQVNPTKERVFCVFTTLPRCTTIRPTSFTLSIPKPSAHKTGGYSNRQRQVSAVLSAGVTGVDHAVYSFRDMPGVVDTERNG